MKKRDIETLRNSSFNNPYETFLPDNMPTREEHKARMEKRDPVMPVEVTAIIESDEPKKTEHHWKENRKTKTISMRMTSEMYEGITQKANAAGIKTSEYITRLIQRDINE